MLTTDLCSELLTNGWNWTYCCLLQKIASFLCNSSICVLLIQLEKTLEPWKGPSRVYCQVFLNLFWIIDPFRNLTESEPSHNPQNIFTPEIFSYSCTRSWLILNLIVGVLFMLRTSGFILLSYFTCEEIQGRSNLLVVTQVICGSAGCQSHWAINCVVRNGFACWPCPCQPCNLGQRRKLCEPQLSHLQNEDNNNTRQNVLHIPVENVVKIKWQTYKAFSI